MRELPSGLWRDLPPAVRVRAAEAFWRDEDSPDIDVQQQEAVVTLARRLKFRPKSVLAQPVERLANQLAHVPDVTEGIAMRALIAYHFRFQRPLMGRFLDELGIAHEDGLITVENVSPPDANRIAAAVETLKTTFDEDDVRIYLRTLVALDGDTWSSVEQVLNG